MARYITIPDTLPVLDPIEGTPTGDQLPFAKTVKVVLTMAVQSGGAQVDAFTMIDVRRKLTEAQPGQVVELTDDEHAAIAPLFKSPRGVTAAFLFSLEEHLRAVVDAPNKRPPA